MENKQVILDSLLDTIRKTRTGNDIERIEYEKGDAVIYWRNGHKWPIEVECCSGIAMIVRICEELL